MEKLKELTGFLVSLAVIIFAAHYFGILKGFSPNDFKNAGNEIVNIVTKQTAGSEKYLTKKSSGNQQAGTYKNYRTNTIPQNVLEGSRMSRTWENIFNSDKKVIFYIYDGNDSRYSYNFHTSVSNYCMNKNIAKNYVLQATALNAFNSVREGEVGPTKICDSFEECSAVQKKAANYSLLENFLRNCGTTMCVFKPQRNQYIRLKTRNASEAKELLNGLINW